MSLQEKPYIGVVGIIDLQGAEGITQTFKQHLPPDSTHHGAVGYLVSSFILDGFNPRPAKYADLDKLPELLSRTRDSAMNMIHYSTHKRKRLPGEIGRLFAYADIYSDELCRALQLNMSWPEVFHIETIKSALPELAIILSINPWILKGMNREEIADRVGIYGDLIDYILIDFSRGKGKTFEASRVAPLYRLLKNDFPKKQIVLAGGFNGANVAPRLTRITYALMSDQFGIDAQSGLREPNGVDWERRFSLSKAEIFVERASAFFSATSTPSA